MSREEAKMTEPNTILYIPHRKNSKHNAIIYISEKATSSTSALAALEETGYEVVSTNSPTVGVALLYAMRSVAAVLLDNRAREQASFDVENSLRQIRPNVPVILLCGDQIDTSPSWTDLCLSADQVSSALQRGLTAEPVVG
jgi:response regulator RpfG family c-di-GMP phosphodiesterase